jgi:hypothetical protein
MRPDRRFGHDLWEFAYAIACFLRKRQRRSFGIFDEICFDGNCQARGVARQED